MKDEQYLKAQDIKNELYIEQHKLDLLPNILERLLKLKHRELQTDGTVDVRFDGESCDINVDKCINFIKAITKQSKGVVTKLENQFKNL